MTLHKTSLGVALFVLAMFMIAGGSMLYADTWTVCPSGCDYDSIQRGIDAAGSGDTVVVGTPGRDLDTCAVETYTELIVMKNGVSVVSEGADTETTYSTGADMGPQHYMLDNDTATANYGYGYDITFDLGVGASETLTHVRVYGKSTTISRVYVGGYSVIYGTTCTGGYMVKQDWVLGDTPAWYETEVTQVSGTRYIRLRSSAIWPDSIFEFQYKAGGDWQTPQTVAAPCTDVEDSFTWVLQRSAKTVIDGADDVGPVVSFLETNTAPTKLDGFTIQNAQSDVEDNPLVGIAGGASNSQVTNCIVQDNQGTGESGKRGGIGTQGATWMATPILASPLIENNWVHNVNGPGIGNGPYSAATIRSNIIWDCNGDDAPGIGLQEDTWPTIEDNIIFGNNRAGIGSREYGLKAKGGTLVIPPIKGNIIHDNIRSGIRLERATGDTGDIHVTIGEVDAINDIYFNNHRSDGRGGGIYLVGITQATIQHNLIHSNHLGAGMAGGNGLYLEDITTTSIIGNDIHENWVGVHFEDYLDSVTIRDNAIHHNHRSGVNTRWYFSTTATINTMTVENNNVYGNNNTGIYNSGANTFYAIGNDIYSNGDAGIRVERGAGSIAQNHIYSNRTGITIANEFWSANNPPNYLITKNNIYQNTGAAYTNQGAGIGISPGDSDFTPEYAPTLVIRQNKVWGQTNTSRGGGIQVVSTYGDITIENNLVYENMRGGLRFGDSTGVVKNNTVVDNGSLAEVEPDVWEGRGGGIIYSSNEPQPSDQPEGTAPTSLFVENNISVGNYKAGIRACFYTTELNRNYNLVYSNSQDFLSDWCGDCASPDCSAGDRRDKRRCRGAQLGAGCDGESTFCCSAIGATGPLPGETLIFADPLFVYMANDDYHLQAGSPARNAGDDGGDLGCYGGAYPMHNLIDVDYGTGNRPAGGNMILFDLGASYNITDVRLYGSATTQNWTVYVGTDAAGCAGAWGTPVGSWDVGGSPGWYAHTLGAPETGSYIKLISTGAVSEDEVFEFQFKEDSVSYWRTPSIVVDSTCTNING